MAVKAIEMYHPIAHLVFELSIFMLCHITHPMLICVFMGFIYSNGLLFGDLGFSRS
jgi:hypothetical protein